MRGPLRKIVRFELYRSDSHPIGTYTVILYLECGHTEWRKASKFNHETQRYARCSECIHAPGRMEEEE